MSTSPPFAPAIRRFFDHVLPNDSGTHTLVLGEEHNYREHWDFLRQHLDQLDTQHHVQTIGLEIPAMFNVLLWAYQDGTLRQALHSDKAVRRYMRAVFKAVTIEDCEPSMEGAVDLAMAAMDRNIRIVAYDSRDARTISPLIHGVMTSIPTQEEQRQEMLKRCAPKWLAEKANPTWVNHEMQWLLRTNPAYQPKLHAMDQLLTAGYHKIEQGKLTSDALSAVMFDTLAEPGNRLVTIGVAHVFGTDAPHPHTLHSRAPHPENDPNHVHSTLVDHLAAIARRRPNDTVASAILGSSEMIDNSTNWHYLDLISDHARTVAERPVYVVDINRKKVTNHSYLAPEERTAEALHEVGFHMLAGFAEPEEPRTIPIVPLREKFLPPAPAITGKEQEAHYRQHINPLLMPDIKRAADAVRDAMGMTLPELWRR